MRSPAYEKLRASEGPFDIIIDPEIGMMELQEIGVADQVKYNGEDRCAYAEKLEFSDVQKILLTLASKFGFAGDPIVETDSNTGKTTRIDVEFHLAGAGGYWAIFWYDGGVGKIHHQEKLEMMIKARGKYPLDRLDYIESRKQVWVNKIADMAKDDYKQGLELNEFNRFIKNNDLLMILEDVTGLGYDVFNFLEDINHVIIRENKKK